MSLAPGTYAIFSTTEGKITVRLFESDAPITVKNFIELAEGSKEWTHPTTRVKSTGKLYDGTIFHRVIPGFMIQGGDPAGTGMGGPGYRFQDETEDSPHRFDKSGKLAMANSGPGTNGCQFFITVAPTPHLTGKHTIFGEVVEGQEIVVKISKVPRGPQDKPRTPVVLESVVIERVGQSMTESRTNEEKNMSGEIPNDPRMSELDAMMNGAANALGYDQSGGISFITSGRRVIGIWVRAFPGNTTKKAFLHCWCEMKNQQPGKDAGLTGIDAAVDSVIMGKYRISKAPDKEGFNIHFL